MAKLKLSKTALKHQRDALKRFERFLPTVELKKEQLILEIQRIERAYQACVEKERREREAVQEWLMLFSEPVDLEEIIHLKKIKTGEDNIAGVAIPVFKGAEFETAEYDLYETPAWLDSGVAVVKRLGSLKAEREILAIQKDRISRELQVTIQRINLFEKIKIPACKENIRKIQIFLGDQQANAVARGKIAKNKLSLAQIDTKV